MQKLLKGSKSRINQIVTEPFKLKIKGLGNFDKEVIYVDLERDDSFEVLKNIKGKFYFFSCLKKCFKLKSSTIKAVLKI